MHDNIYFVIKVENDAYKVVAFDEDANGAWNKMEKLSSKNPGSYSVQRVKADDVVIGQDEKSISIPDVHLQSMRLENSIKELLELL
jgi:hypothetical protein